VHARACRILGAEADDVVQEVFVRLLGAEPRAEAVASFVYKTSNHLCIDRLRHTARRERPDWRHEAGRPFAPGESIEALLGDKQLCRHFLQTAPKTVTETAMLYYFDEMTQAEVAEQLGISRKTVLERLDKFHEHARDKVRAWKI
jgi:RNA polymerase sigma factor (sigma-70 family)